MIKYLREQIVFKEIPTEISLCFEITRCPNRCSGCHSPELREDIGNSLTIEELNRIILKYSSGDHHLFSCILFMGGEQHTEFENILRHCKLLKLKTALYTGADSISDDLAKLLDYVKVGKYNKNLGALRSKTTNQALYKLINEQEDLPAEYSRIVDEDFWDLI